jgi:hypothetical protein
LHPSFHLDTSAEIATKEQPAAKPSPSDEGISRYEQTPHHSLGWFLERVGWALMGGVVLGAALGFFGNGFFSTADVVSRDGDLAVRYERYWRALAPGEVELRWPAEAGAATIWIEGQYLDHFEVGGVSPAPAAVAIGAERSYYTFNVQERSTTARVSFRLEPKRAGSFAGMIGRVGGGTVAIEQLVFP